MKHELNEEQVQALVKAYNRDISMRDYFAERSQRDAKLWCCATQCDGAADALYKVLNMLGVSVDYTPLALMDK